jgi:hypothetical protein
VNARPGGSWIRGFRITVDHCVCVTTSVELQTIPDFTWTRYTSPSAFNLDVYYALDPSWPGLDQVNGDSTCFGTLTMSPDTNANSIDDTHQVVTLT